MTKRHRRLIRALIKSKVPKKPKANFALYDLQDACFFRSCSVSSISFIIPTQGIHINRIRKTAGLLYRGPSFSVVAAVSGWTGHATEEFREPEAGFERLNETYWQSEIFKIADEPQLMSYFIRKHYIFRNYNDGETVEDDFLQLFLLQPRQTHAHIIVSKAPCGSCLNFAEAINQKLGITFNFQTPDLKE